MLNKWVEDWNSRIAKWIEQDNSNDMGLSFVRNAYKGEGKRSLEDAMPEPYVGNPLSKDKVDAVMLTLNPGGSGPEQCLPDGTLIKNVRNSCYYDVASYYLLSNTKKWWMRRSQWPARLMGENEVECSIVGIDLFPWHSKEWGCLEFTPDVLVWLKNNVFMPAAAVAEQSKLSRHFNVGYPLVLAIGAQHAHCLKQLGFTCLNEGAEEFHILRSQHPVKRNFRIFVSEELRLAVLQTDSRGTFLPPSKGFDEIVKKLLLNI